MLGSIQKSSNEWQQLANQLAHESHGALHCWKKAVTSRLQHLSSGFATEVSAANMLDAMPVSFILNALFINAIKASAIQQKN
jgi:hypothetical protein